MNKIIFWAIKVKCPESYDQVRYTQEYDLALKMMNQAHTDFVKHLKTRTDIDQSRIIDKPIPRQLGVDILQEHQVEEWSVKYPVDAGVRDGEPAFIWKKAYFYIQEQEFDLFQKSDDPKFDLF